MNPKLLVFAVALLFASCVPASKQRSAGCQNGYAGYGTKIHTDHGARRRSY